MKTFLLGNTSLTKGEFAENSDRLLSANHEHSESGVWALEIVCFQNKSLS